MVKVLVTGSNGFIARHLIKKLKKTHEICTTSKEDDVVQVLDNFKPEFIFHLGAELGDQERMFDSNVVQTLRILEWSRKNPVQKLVLFGSSSEYGRATKPRAEGDCPVPDTIYEGTKAASAMLARAWSVTYGIPVTFIRPFTVYGPDEKPNKLTQILFQKWKDHSVLKLSDGVHDYVYIEDFIKALCVVAFAHEPTSFNLVNIGSGRQYTNYEFVRAFQREIGYTFPVELVDTGRSYDSTSWVADTTLLKTRYGIEFEGLEWGIKRLVVDYLNNGENS
jgi:UDP-glucuronate 4-epimerase